MILNFIDDQQFFTYAREAQPDPVTGEPMPALGAVEAPLPETTLGQWHGWRYEGGAWIAREDHRGREGYVNGEPTTITEWGPLPEGWTEEKPVVPPTEEEEYNAKRLAIWVKHTGEKGPIDIASKTLATAKSRANIDAGLIAQRETEYEEALDAMQDEFEALAAEYNIYTPRETQAKPYACTLCAIDTEPFTDRFRGPVWVCERCGNAMVEH